ncbi:maleylpyruvate isomerase family mycothiol-dependent enzyme [Kitasatospora sp. NPDC088783]|uniref:maleylpyruvate isomerase family mycothiol-dependent enzyme n=1 Tax=Kitasatospora sp. NPDC088783 TaxID=3364077 RepID=UPI0038062D19
MTAEPTQQDASVPAQTPPAQTPPAPTLHASTPPAPTPHDPAEQLAAYRRSRAAIAALASGLPDPAAVGVPACPDWSVRDLIGHLVHICESFVALEDSQIDLAPLTGAPAAELLDRWEELDGALPAALERTPELRRRILLLDVFSHELDLRLGLDVPAEPTAHPAFDGALDLSTMGFGLAVHGGGLPALRIETPGRAWVVGEGDPAATVRGSAVDVFRSLTGRRTRPQIEDLEWSGEPAGKWAQAFAWGPFAPPAAEVEPLVGR